MRTAIIYSSSHGKTAKVVGEVVPHLSTHVDVYNARDLQNTELLRSYDLLLFFCPTYGDEELQEDMENFLRGFEQDLDGRFFAICELGSYYGYDDFSFGAMRIIRQHLLKLNGQELCEPLSLDSFPKVNWKHLFDWVDYLKGRLNEHVRYCHA